MGRKLIVVYGAPRTGTTHLWQALRKHGSVFGSEETNEPSNVEDIDGLWRDEMDKYIDSGLEEGKPLATHLAIKAPGYGFMWEFFNGLEGYECSYIFTDREMHEVLDSMSNHEMSRSICDFDFDSTDCPDHMKDRFREKWDKCGGLIDEQRILRRCHYRYVWHVEGYNSEMFQASLRLVPYESRLYCANVAYRILTYAGLKGENNEFLTELSKFHHRAITFERRQWIYRMID